MRLSACNLFKTADLQWPHVEGMVQGCLKIPIDMHMWNGLGWHDSKLLSKNQLEPIIFIRIHYLFMKLGYQKQCSIICATLQTIYPWSDLQVLWTHKTSMANGAIHNPYFWNSLLTISMYEILMANVHVSIEAHTRQCMSFWQNLANSNSCINYT